MIYTTYFTNLRNLPKHIVPISICGKPPNGWDGLQYKKLAPKYDFFMKWKKNHDNDYYIAQFNKKVLGHITPTEVVMELHHLCDKSIYSYVDIALVCYEKPGDFCHRHLVAEWLKNGGFNCEEWVKNEQKK